MELIEIYCTLLSFPSNSKTCLRPFCRAGRRSKSWVCQCRSQPVYSLWASRPVLPVLPLFHLPIQATVKSSGSLGSDPFSRPLCLFLPTLWKDILWEERFCSAQFCEASKIHTFIKCQTRKILFSCHNLGPSSQLPVCKTQRTYTSL